MEVLAIADIGRGRGAADNQFNGWIFFLALSTSMNLKKTAGGAVSNRKAKLIISMLYLDPQ